VQRVQPVLGFDIAIGHGLHQPTVVLAARACLVGGDPLRLRIGLWAHVIAEGKPPEHEQPAGQQHRRHRNAGRDRIGQVASLAARAGRREIGDGRAAALAVTDKESSHPTESNQRRIAGRKH
jgi:hypothetical protein